MNNIVLKNLLLYPPVEGGREAHQAWKQSVRLLAFGNGEPVPYAPPLWAELLKPGFVTRTCADMARAYSKNISVE